MNRILALFTLLLLGSTSFAQRGKDGPGVITGAGTIVNDYTILTADATAGATTITVQNNSLNAFFGGVLAAGDLIFIYQAQGADLLGDNTAPPLGTPNSPAWGEVTAYDDCGNYEFAEVVGVTGATGITLSCALQHDYTAIGRVQIVRVPRYTTLTVNAGASITAPAWNSAAGGIVVVESDGNAVINGSLDADGLGFRGGALNNNSTFSAQWTSSQDFEGAEKGESIGGYQADYDAMGGRYCRAAPGNGGAGGNAHNCGGGGGSNAAPAGLTWTGFGRVNTAYNVSWNLEAGWLVNHNRAGGGRGGYGHSSTNADATLVGPSNSAWGGDWRRPYGGQGGRVMDYSTGKIFFGGGGGAGDQNNDDGGAGGSGGGLVFVSCYGNVTGTGTITANGDNGGDTDPSNPPFGGFAGNDAAGGAGGGGCIIMNTNGSSSGVTISADGGTGGYQLLLPGAFGSVGEAEGPGGGGGGGYIAISAGAPTRTAGRGDGGLTNSPHLSEFPPNGATGGSFGRATESVANYYPTAADIAVCVGIAGTLTATINGTAPVGTVIGWFDSEVSGTLLGVGTTYSPGVIGSTTTYYVGLCPGHYRIPVTITVSPAMVVNATGIVIIDESCAGNDGSITGITITGGTAPIVFDWNGSVTVSEDLSGATGGSYTLTATDAAGCVVTSGPHIIATVGGPVVDISNIVITAATCGNNNGTITGITVSGGTGTYGYSWNPGGATTLDLTNVGANGYTLTVTDLGNACQTVVGPFVINDTPAPTIDINNMVIANENCGNADGSITGIVIVGGTAPITYDWSGSSTLGPDTVGLAAGAYTITVTDLNGCTASSGPHAIVNSPAPTLDITNISITDENCGGFDGAITGILVVGGTGPFSYDWNGSTTLGADSIGLGAGGYTLTVTDANGCTGSSGPHVVNGVGGPVIDITNVVVVDEDCGAADGSITGINVSGGSGNYAYDWSGNGTLGADTVNIGAGSYTLTVTDISNSCVSAVGPFVVNDNAGPIIDITNISIANDTCVNGVGSITGIVVTGGTAPLVYDWNGGVNNDADTTQLSAGNYTLTVTDANSCVASNGPHVLTSLLGPSIDASNVVITDENCSGTDGSITGIIVTGGNAPIQFDWSGTPTLGADTINIGAGSYTLNIVDALGCTASSGPHAVNNNPAPTLDITGLTIADETCTGANGSITGIIVVGGSGNFTYDWSGNGTLGTDTTALAAGSYTLTVTDLTSGCSVSSGPHAVTNSPTPTLDITGLTIADDTCGNGVGSITGIVVIGGTAPYTYDWNGGSSSSPDTTQLNAGNYTFTVTDANGCTATTGPYAVNTLAGPTIDDSNMLIIPENCGGVDGAIVNIAASGGTAPLSYAWNGNGTFGLDTIALAAGSYTLVVTDANGCSATGGPYAVNANGGPVIDVANVAIVDESCTGTNGQITGITVSGGSGTYFYDWNGSTTLGGDTIGLGAGNYTLTVTDQASGCVTLAGPFAVTDSPGPIIDITNMVIADDTCAAGIGSITGIAITGGTAPLVYDWNGAVSTTADTLSLSGGGFTLTVTDANGCTATDGPFAVNTLAGPSIDVTNILIVGENCGAADGSITGITVTGGNAPLVYDWNGGTSTTPDTLNLVAGSYTFTVTDAFGCAATSGPHDVIATGGPTVDISNMVVADENCGNGDGSITGIVATGTGTLSYDWNGAATSTADTTGLSAGTFTLTVTDGSGCATVVGPFDVNASAAPTLLVAVSNSAGCAPFTTDFTASSDIGVIYDWDFDCDGLVDLSGTSATPTWTYSTPGTYTVCVTVTSADGCTTTVTGPAITVFDVPTADFNFVAPTNCDSATVQFTNNSSGATAYLWDFAGLGTSSSTDPSYSFTAQGIYDVCLTATNASGCAESICYSVSIEECLDTVALVIPNVFSPNGDGINDQFRIEGLAGLGNSMFIYNRWGQLLYSTEDYVNNWDGYTQSGIAAPAGTYYFFLRLEDGEEINGHVTLVR
jgi:gliding motility-associated-like protein